MTKGKRNAVIVMSVAVLLLVSMAVGAGIVGTDKILSLIGGKKPGTTEVTGDDGGNVQFVTSRPAKLSAIFVRTDKLGLSSSSDIKTNSDIIAKAAENIKNKGFDSVFIAVPEESGFACSDGKIDVISALSEKAKEQGLYVCLVYGGTEFEKDELSSLGSSFDCVAFSGDMTAEQRKNAVGTLHSENKKVSAALFVNASNAADCAAVLDSRFADFLISFPADKSSAGEKYVSSLERVNDSARGSGLSFAAAVRANLFASDGTDEAMMITEQLDACDSLDSCVGTVMYDYEFFSSDNSLASAILKYIAERSREELEKDFELRNFEGSTKTTNESKITFTGSSSPLSPLKLNGKDVKREANGDFSFESELKVGKNEFSFEHKGKTHKYTITYEIKILESMTPTKSMEVPVGSNITVTATALKGSNVTASLGGTKVKLKQQSNFVQDENGTKLDENSDFAVYSGKISIPASTSKVQSLGRIKVYASFNGLSATMSGASVSVSAVIPTPEPTPTRPDTTEHPSTDKPSNPSGGTTTSPSTGGNVDFDPSKMLTPYAYAGVAGRSKMCEITSLCETMPANVVDDCVPYSSPLPAGTFDYISSEYTYGGSKYYRLASGRNILASKTKLIAQGYNLPQNKVSVVASSSNSDATTIKFGFTWKVPFNVAVKNQSYIPSSQASGGSLYAVTAFNGKYVDITFSHSGNVVGKINVSGSKIVSAAQWITDSKAKTLTLRLTLRTPGRFYGYSVGYTSDGCLTLKIKAKPASSLSGSVIMIDAGHGGNDSGAICAYNPNNSKKYEKQINLLLAQKIKAKLEARGATVIMTRSNDTYVSLNARANMGRTKNPDMFIAVHCDSSESASPMGTTAYYYQAYSFPLASAVHKRIVSAYKSSIYSGAGSATLNKIDRGTNMYPFRVTRIEECPAVLIEYGFVSNIRECKLLWSDSVQERLAQATVDGIADYIASN